MKNEQQGNYAWRTDIKLYSSNDLTVRRRRLLAPAFTRLDRRKAVVVASTSAVDERCTWLGLTVEVEPLEVASARTGHCRLTAYIWHTPQHDTSHNELHSLSQLGIYAWSQNPSLHDKNRKHSKYHLLYLSSMFVDAIRLKPKIRCNATPYRVIAAVRTTADNLQRRRSCWRCHRNRRKRISDSVCW